MNHCKPFINIDYFISVNVFSKYLSLRQNIIIQSILMGCNTSSDSLLSRFQSINEKMHTEIDLLKSEKKQIREKLENFSYQDKMI